MEAIFEIMHSKIVPDLNVLMVDCGFTICLFASLENGISIFPVSFSLIFQRFTHSGLADSSAVHWDTTQ